MSGTPSDLGELRDDGALKRAELVEMVIASSAEGRCARTHDSYEHLEEPVVIVSSSSGMANGSKLSRT